MQPTSLRRFAFVASAALVAACGLLVDTGDLSGGAGAPDPTSGDAAVDGGNGGGGDGGGGSDANQTTDSGGDAAVSDTGTDSPAPTYRDIVIAEGPLAYYRLAETGNSGSVAKDEMGAHNGTYAGTNDYNQAGPAASVPSVRFKGSGHVSANSLSLLPVGTFASYTFEMFVASEVPAGVSSFFLQFAYPGGGGGPALFVDDATRTYRHVAHGDIVDSTIVLGATWHHLAITSSGTTVKIYVDGALDVSGTEANPTPDRGLFTIGTNTSSTDGGSPSYNSSFKGRIAEVAIYGKALDATRIAAHYAARP